MEEILSSIKRIIAEEEGAPAGRRRAPPRQPEPADQVEEDVLELRETVVPAPSPPASAPITASPAPHAFIRPQSPEPKSSEPKSSEPTRTTVTEAPSPAPPPPPPAPAEPPADPIVSSNAVDAARGSLDALTRAMRPEPAGLENMLEGMVREMLKPMLRDWLDARLPGLVEQLVAQEISRITGRKG